MVVKDLATWFGLRSYLEDIHYGILSKSYFDEKLFNVLTCKLTKLFDLIRTKRKNTIIALAKESNTHYNLWGNGLNVIFVNS